VLASGDDLGAAARRSGGPDMVLGGPGDRFEALVDANVLSRWEVWRRLTLSLTVKRAARRTSSDSETAPEAPSRRVTFDDPRRDPVALAWAKSVLASGSWPEGYARLIREAGGPVAPGRQAGAALAAVERGEAEAAPGVERAVSSRVVTRPIPGAPEWVEGLGVVQNARHAKTALAFLDHLVAIGVVEEQKNRRSKEQKEDALLADLLGATLVEARPELLAAWDALNGAGRPERAEMWMTQPPPWPPASVQEMLERRPSGMELLDTLAAQVAPEADLRAWLVRSWLGGSKQVDGALLDELATAEGGRLARSPRFRSWLRAEWTAWARQRYRRVARLVQHGPYEERAEDQKSKRAEGQKDKRTEGQADTKPDAEMRP
jgi:hypothetical protein